LRKSIAGAVVTALLTALLVTVHQPAGAAQGDSRTQDIARAVAAAEKAEAAQATLVTPVRVSGAPHKVDGPSDYRSEAAGVPAGSSVQAWALPFNYGFDVSYGIYGREFVSGTGKVCTWLKVYKTSGGEPLGGPFISVELYENNARLNPAVQWPIDNQWYTWCWSTVNTRTYKWWVGMGTRGNNVWVHGDGTAENG
jgi:hypothetical protein